MEPYYEELLTRMTDKEAVKEIENKKRRFEAILVSYLLLPIQLFGKTMGALRIETNQFEKRSITQTMAADLAAVVRLFFYALTKIRFMTALKLNSPRTESTISA